MKQNSTWRLGLMLGVTAGISGNADGQIRPDGYECGTEGNCAVDFARTHNNSLEITNRTLVCQLPTVMGHWYDLSDDSDLAGRYSTLKCANWSLWSSSNPSDQVFTIRVYQDLTPESRSPVCPSQGFGITNEPGPDVASQLLLWEQTTVFPPSTQGVNSLTQGRTDGDRSISFNGPVGGGILLSPDVAFFVEVEHRGEAVNRFGANLQGEAGDETGGPEVTWVKSPNCGGGGCTTVAGTTVGDWSKWSEFAPSDGSDRDFVMQIHLDEGDTSGFGCDLCFRCAGDANQDKVINIGDLLAVLRDWTPGYCRLSGFRTGDVYPCCRDGKVNVNDLLDVLGNWGYCPLLNDDCADNIILYGVGTAFWHNLESTNDGPIHPNLGIGSYCGFDDQVGDVFGPGDIWFFYVTRCPGVFTFSTEGSTGIVDTIMEIWQSNICGQFLPSDLIACNDDIGPDNLHSRISLDMATGERVLIRLAGRGGEQGHGKLTINLEPATTPDCNGNGRNDTCDIFLYYESRDWNGNGVPDECDARGDFNGDGIVDVVDLLRLLGAWGACPWSCPPDTNDDDQVDVIDLLKLLANWRDPTGDI